MKRNLVKLTITLIAAVLLTLVISYSYSRLSSSNRPSDQPQVPALTTVFSLSPSLQFKNGERIEDNVHLRWVREHLGIDIHYLWTAPDSTFTTKLKLHLLNGKKMPDIVPVRTDIVHDLIDSGQFMAVDELIDQYASPVWKDALQEDPSVWYPYIRNGKRYAIPILDYNYNSDTIMWIREDWLKNVGLDVPKTLPEIEEVLDAFTNRDPDRNGKNDTYGLAVSLQHSFNTWMSDISWVFGMYGTLPSQWNKVERGHLSYGSVQEQAKQGLMTLTKWKSAGYFADEAMWQDEEMAATLFSQGKAGVIVGPHWMRYWPLDSLKLNNPDANIIAVPLPEGPAPTSYYRANPPRNGAILINKNMAKPELLFTYMNYLFENQGMGKGSYQYGLAEDYDYTVVNGKPTADRTLIPGGYVHVSAYTLTYDGARIPSRWYENVAREEKQALISQLPRRKPTEFWGPPTPTMKEKWEQLLQMEHETYLQILYGKKDISFFDEFVRRWSANGGMQIEQEVNQWYSSTVPISK
ncbi:extracellular solute-binding protein [Paenibacillus sp. NEAU-GSW1]|uniref:extracellular solute-binding protein n=1 Tax=Paenibacillus sp. NEAU-GSW1 TaxID=2682486 RepID=UPI0012E0D23C|nr:extracellular solute-binding protein [Paenibacillus sp. NEAU-GSW1]MUT64858.1 extracellular solute-binding protein [Paenibacillus sp. NEAU-GSW1]